jgi:nucleoside-diphosphate-sugar epimerase
MAELRGARALVTGAAGFLGRHLVHRLVDEGARVAALDTAEGIAARVTEPELASAAWYGTDLRDAASCRAIIQEACPEYVFHLAGRVDLSRTDELAQACVAENAAITLNVCSALRYHRPRALIFSSTVEVYGRNAAPFDESQPIDPPSPYAITKVAAERVCLAIAAAHRFGAVVLRLATVYGPGQAPQRFIPSVIRAALRREPLAVTSGAQRRDFLYVDDAVEGLVRAAVTPAAYGRTLNLGHEHPVSLRDIVEIIRAELETSWQPEYGSRPERAGEAAVWSTRSDAARAVLGWQPQIDLEDGLQLTIQAFEAAGAAAARTA